MENKSRSKSQKKEQKKADEKFAMDFDKLIDSLRKENDMLRNIASSLESLEKDFSKSKKKS